ncbi:MAG: ABC transporter permease [Solirubrobacteraceae bacterium]|jgi:ABC-2 type transport system permease protein
MFLLFRLLQRRWREHQARAGQAPGGQAPGGRPGAGPRKSSASGSPSATGPSAAARGPLVLLGHQLRFDLLASARNPRARFFTFLFPISLLVIFVGLFGHGTTVVDGVTVKLSRFFVPGILALSIISAAYASLVVSVATARETGILKRRRATPVPAWVLVGGQALSTLVIAAAMAVILLVIAKLLYHVGFGPGALVAIACTIILGTLAFACVGFAVAGLIGSLDAAQPIVQATLFPLYFISGVWIPTQSLSHTLRSIGSLFPVEHLAAALHLASVKGSFASAISPTDLLVLAAWALAATVFAAWRFSWLPSTATA